MWELFLFITGPCWDHDFLSLFGGYSYIQCSYIEVLMYNGDIIHHFSFFREYVSLCEKNKQQNKHP